MKEADIDMRSVGVIAAYKGQRNLIIDMIKQSKLMSYKQSRLLEVSTIDAF